MWVQTKDQINECIQTYKRGVAYVDLDAVIGYKKDGIKHNFLEDY